MTFRLVTDGSYWRVQKRCWYTLGLSWLTEVDPRIWDNGFYPRQFRSDLEAKEWVRKEYGARAKVLPMKFHP